MIRRPSPAGRQRNSPGRYKTATPGCQLATEASALKTRATSCLVNNEFRAKIRQKGYKRGRFQSAYLLRRCRHESGPIVSQIRVFGDEQGGDCFLCKTRTNVQRVL